MSKDVTLNPPRPGNVRLSMEEIALFEDHAKVPWKSALDYFAAVKAVDEAKEEQAKADRGEEAAVLPKSVEELEERAAELERELPMIRISVTMIWLRYRQTNRKLRYSDVANLSPDDFSALVATAQEAQAEGNAPLERVK